MEATQQTGRIICAICYDEANPAGEHLQSISVCGHVFHELCLQQWLEYCPHGRKPTCPVCKQTCLSTDAHRLFFQSSSDHSTANISSKILSQSLSLDKKSIEFFHVEIQKLKGQLAVANSALLAHQDQQTELTAKLEQTEALMQNALSAQQESVVQKKHYKELLLETQEALQRSSLECSNLFEQNATLSKELAALKLIADVNLGEEDALQLASFGRATNKDDVITTLLKSLIIRNRTYKELMLKCNGLGRNESIAYRKSAKVTEQMKRLRVRVQELERALEEKENGILQPTRKSIESACQTSQPFLSETCGTGKSVGVEEAIELQGTHPNSLTCNSTELVEEATSKVTKFLVGAATTSEGGFHAALGVLVADSNTTSITVPPQVGPEYCRSLLSESQDRHIIVGASPPGILISCKQNSLPIPIRREVGLAQGLPNAQRTFPGKLEETGNAITGCMVASNVRSWCNQAQMHVKKRCYSANSVQTNLQSQNYCGSLIKDFTFPSYSGNYIVSGANGRGGHIKVVKRQQSLVVNNLSAKGTNKLKKCKGNFVQRSKTNSRAALQLDHFFCHAT